MTPFMALAALVAVLASLGDYLHRTYADQHRKREEPVPESRFWLNPFDLAAVAALVAFAGLRYQVGTDYRSYQIIYRNLFLGDWRGSIEQSPQEFGYTVLLLAVKTVTDSPYAVFWVSAFLTVVPIYAVLKRHSALPALSITLFVLLAYVPAFNGVRQSLAAALLFLAWSYMGRRNVWFVALAVVASTIHVSAAIAAIALVLTRRSRLSGKTVSVVAVLAVAGAVLVGRVPALAQLVGGLNDRYGAYLLSGETGLGSYLNIAAYIVLLTYAVVIGARNNPPSQRDHQLAVYVLLGIGFMVVGTQALVVFRMSEYFTLFALLLIANRVAASKDRLLASLLIVAASTVYFALHLTNYGDVIPYQTYTSVQVLITP